MASRDTIDWVLASGRAISVLCSVTAVAFTAVAVRRAERYARAAQAAVELERAITFHLGVLRDLGELNLSEDRSDRQIARLKLLAAMLPIEMIPLSRVLAGMHTTWEAAKLRDDTADRLKSNPHTDFHGYPVWDALRQDVAQEILAAVWKASSGSASPPKPHSRPFKPRYRSAPRVRTVEPMLSRRRPEPRSFTTAGSAGPITASSRSTWCFGTPTRDCLGPHISNAVSPH